MSRLSDLIRQVSLKDDQLATDLQREVAALNDRRAFGLNFERHVPEAVELPGRPIRKGDKVRCLPERGKKPTQENEKLYRVTGVYAEDGQRWADIVAMDDSDEAWAVVVEDLVVVAEFRDPIYPGLASTGKVERGGDKPFHAVINAENFHALQTLLFTHRGKVDCIYIDPPYNTGARDWKYNNDYVESDDNYRHSKWLAFMERRLKLPQELLDPDGSVLIVTIDEKEYLRLGLLLAQVFPDARMQMVSSIINPTGAIRFNEFTRVNEMIFFVMVGSVSILPESVTMEEAEPVRWNSLRRFEMSSRRGSRPSQFYGIYVDRASQRIVGVTKPLSDDIDRHTVEGRSGCDLVFPLKPDGTEMIWGLTGDSLMGRVKQGYARAASSRGGFSIYYLTSGKLDDIASGEIVVSGREADGSAIVERAGNVKTIMPLTQWNKSSHSAQAFGTKLLSAILPDRRFPFPKSLYAVEDSLRFFIGGNPTATVVDFFAGSGTTAHAVMRLNRQDAGRRRSISVTNNEVSVDEQRGLRAESLRPGDHDWEALGICEYITKPRLEAAITGTAPDGGAIKGDYKFTDEFPMGEGLDENVEFFTLTYEAPLRISSHREFGRIAPLLWMRAGSIGRRIDDVSKGWDVADMYGVLADLDMTGEFVEAMAMNERASVAYVVTDDERLFQSVVRELQDHVEPVRLYEAYLRNFEIEAGRGAR